MATGKSVRIALSVVLSLALPTAGAAMGTGNTAPIVDAPVALSQTPVPSNGSVIVTCNAHDDFGVAAIRVSVSAGTLADSGTDTAVVTFSSIRTPATATFEWWTPAVATPIAGSSLTFTNGGTDVVGVGTSFTTQLHPGDLIRPVGTGTWLTVQSITDDLDLVLASNFTGSTITGPAELKNAQPTISCDAQDDGTSSFTPTQPLWSSPVSISADVEDLLIAGPTVANLAGTPSSILVGAQVQLSADVTTQTGTRTTYDWTATGGTISASTITSTGVVATWRPETCDALNVCAPVAPGSYTITLTVTDAYSHQAQQQTTVQLAWAGAGPAISIASFNPEKVALDSAGNVYVTDARQSSILVFTKSGSYLRRITVNNRVQAVAVGQQGEIYWAEAIHYSGSSAGLVHVLDASGQPIGDLAGTFVNPADIAIGPVDGRVYVADDTEVQASPPLLGEIKVYDPGSRQLLATWTLDAGFPNGIAADPAGDKIYVSTNTNVLDGSGAVLGQIRVYGLDGVPVAPVAIAPFGSANGQITKPGGLAVGSDGNIYIADVFQGYLGVFKRDGTFLAFAGTSTSLYGDAPLGQLNHPQDVAADANGHVFVTNTWCGRVEVFQLQGASAPACPGDSDCDGIPDSWEIANGYPIDGSGAWADADRDGIPNIVEIQMGLNPLNADSDGDGVSDGDELAAGTNPLDPSDNRPVAAAGTDRSTEPTRVVLDGHASSDPNGDTLSYAWTQVGGPTVTLTGASTAAPSFIARKAGDYKLQLVVNDGKVNSLPSVVTVTVLDVAPTADAGPDVGGTPFHSIQLDGRFSSDANGDALTYSWRQLSGPANVTLSGSATAGAKFTPRATGVYAFELTVSDGKHAATATTHVVVDDLADHVPVAMAGGAVAPIASQAIVGVPSFLDGSASADADGSPLTFAWTQVEGPAAPLVDATKALAVFTPPQPGVYVFELVVGDGAHASLPDRLTVVASGDAVPPRSDAGADRRVALYDDVTLGCPSLTGTCAWRQVEGVHVPLAAAGAGSKFVPIETGTYSFELQVTETGLAGTKARVAITVDAAGATTPSAVATTSSLALATPGPNDLDGDSSQDPDPG